MIRNIIRRLSNPLLQPSAEELGAARQGQYYFTLTNNMVFEVKNNFAAQHIPYARLLEIVDHVLVLLSIDRIPADGSKVSLKIENEQYTIQQVEGEYLTLDRPLLASVGYGGIKSADQINGSVINALNWREDDGPEWPRIQFTFKGMAFSVKDTVRPRQLSQERLDQVMEAFRLATSWNCDVRVGIQLRLYVGLSNKRLYTVRYVA